MNNTRSIDRSFFESVSRPVRRTIDRFLLPATIMLLLLALAGCSQDHAAEKTTTVAPLPAATWDGVIVAVGDSLTAGLGVPEDQAYPAQLARRLRSDGHNYQVVNAGVSGETSSGVLSRIQWVMSSLEPDIVILETGANDGMRGLDPDLLKENLNQLVTIMKEGNIQVILTGMHMFPNLGPEYTRAFSRIYPQVAEKHQVIFMPFFLEGVAGMTHLNQSDKLHPNTKGYTRIVESIYPFVLAAIKQHDAG